MLIKANLLFIIELVSLLIIIFIALKKGYISIIMQYVLISITTLFLNRLSIFIAINIPDAIVLLYLQAVGIMQIFTIPLAFLFSKFIIITVVKKHNKLFEK